MTLLLPRIPPTWVPATEMRRNQLLELADRENHKRGQDIEVGNGKLILRDSATGTRYELEIADNGYVKIKTIDGVEVPGLNQSQFSENVSVQRTPIIELNSAYGVSALRDVQTVTGTGAISATGGEFLLSTGATATSSALLESAELGRYIPGYGAEVGIGTRTLAAPTGNVYANWGGRDPGKNNGFYFGQDATSRYVARLSGGSETKVRQSSWNIDTLDGTGTSGITLSQTTGYIWQIDFTWYGYGQILFGVVDVLNDVQRLIPCHSMEVDTSVSIQNPNLAVFAEADNGGDATDFDLYVGGRQYSIVGKYVPSRRLTGQERASVNTSTAAVPLVTFRRKSAFLDRSVRVQGFSVDVSSQPVIVEIRLNGSLTAASYGTPTNHTAGETALEVDTSATAISGGEVVYSKYFDAGLGASSVAGETTLAFDLEIPRAQPVSLCARTLTGTGAIVSHMQMAEEW